MEDDDDVYEQDERDRQGIVDSDGDDGEDLMDNMEQ